MRLPRHLLESKHFLFESIDDFVIALGDSICIEELVEISKLDFIELPAISSSFSLALLIGVNPGIIWSFLNRNRRHYKIFEIKSGKKTRRITAPRVGLKIIQKWLSVQLYPHYRQIDHVFGFVTGRSHIDAALRHCGANWILSVDIEKFFQSTPSKYVEIALQRVGYNADSAKIISDLCCYCGYLAQGAPTSPLLSNMVLSDIDLKLRHISQVHNITLTRYADDIVFSGRNAYPPELLGDLEAIFATSPWKLSKDKTLLSKRPFRLKVHGLLVDGEEARLTKGYRNKLRAYRHILAKMTVESQDYARLSGHINYANDVSKKIAATHIMPQALREGRAPQRRGRKGPSLPLPPVESANLRRRAKDVD